MNDLLYLNEHLSCHNYSSNIQSGFVLKNYQSGDTFVLPSDMYHILFVLSGEYDVCCNKSVSKHFNCGDFILIAKCSEGKGEVVSDGQILFLGFDTPLSVCEKLIFSSFVPLCEQLKYDFEPLKIRYPLDLYLNLLVGLLGNKMNCIRLHEMKHQELFLVLRGFYSKEELAMLLYPLLMGKSTSFKELVLQHYEKAETADALAQLCNMSKSPFYEKFKDEFGMPAKQWLVQQKVKQIDFFMKSPDVTVNDVVEKFGFSSISNFTRFTKQHFGVTPAVMLKSEKESR